MQDRFARGRYMPSIDDMQNVEMISAREEGPYTVMAFSRSIRACESQDRDIEVSTGATWQVRRVRESRDRQRVARVLCKLKVSCFGSFQIRQLSFCRLARLVSFGPTTLGTQTRLTIFTYTRREDGRVSTYCPETLTWTKMSYQLIPNHFIYSTTR